VRTANGSVRHPRWTSSGRVVGIVPAEDAEATDLRRWFSERADIRNDAGVAEEVLAFIGSYGIAAKSSLSSLA
jgi:hypothetical protein